MKWRKKNLTAIPINTCQDIDLIDWMNNVNRTQHDI